MNEYVAVFLEGYNATMDFDGVCESACCDVYNYMNGEEITTESFKEKMKAGFDKVCETVKKWIQRIKGVLSRVKKWVVNHAKMLMAKIGGKKEVENVAAPEQIEAAANEIEEAAKAVEMAANTETPEPSLKEKVIAAFNKAKDVISTKAKKIVTPKDVVRHCEATEKAADRVMKAVEITRTASRKIKGGWVRGAASKLVKTSTAVLKKSNADLKKMIGNSIDKAEVGDFDALMGGSEDDFDGVVAV